MGKKHELMMISEPEAAAVYALKTTPPKGMKVEGTFLENMDANVGVRSRRAKSL